MAVYTFISSNARYERAFVVFGAKEHIKREVHLLNGFNLC